MVDNIAADEKAQMMTIEAFLGALLIIAALLFVVSQAPSSIQQSAPYAETQLYHFGENSIELLQYSNSTKDYDNLMQYYISEKRFDDLDDFINETLPDNIEYNIEFYDGKRGFWIVRNGNPAKDSITINSLIATKGIPLYGIGNLSGIFISKKSFANGSLIIPMDKNQTNVITAYNLISNVLEMGIPVYQLLQDPRGETNHPDWNTPINTTDNPWNESPGITENRSYMGGPYVINAADLNPIDINNILNLSQNPISVPSKKIDIIEFAASMTGISTNLSFNLSDNSIRYVNLTIEGENINVSTSYTNGTDSQYLNVDTTSVAFDDNDDKKIIGMVMFNTNTSNNLTVSNINSSNVKILNITIDRIRSDPMVLNTDLLHNDPSRRVTIHKSVEYFDYDSTTWLVRSPKIAVYPKHGTMMNYYSDSGLPYDVLENGNILNQELFFYDILFIPHTDVDIKNSMPDDVALNIVEWVSYGGTLLVECKAIDGIEDRVSDVYKASIPWNTSFIGINIIPESDNNTIKLIGNDQRDNFGDYYPLSGRNGSYFSPLAQTFTVSGDLPGVNGTISSFKLKNTNSLLMYNPDNNIMAVPLDGISLDYPEITFIEATFDKGTVIYIGGHDQSTFSPNRERLIFNSIMYSTTAKVYSYGLTELRITMWYK
jgi:hypothetical protein